MKQFALTLLFTIVPLLASADSVEIDGICYNLVSKTKTAEVAKKTSGEYSGAIVIPEKITYNGEEYSVTSIGKGAFYSCTALTPLNHADVPLDITRYTLTKRNIGQPMLLLFNTTKVNACINWEVGTGFVLYLC
jgi:hypothetical protein